MSELIGRLAAFTLACVFCCAAWMLVVLVIGPAGFLGMLVSVLLVWNRYRY